MIHAGPRFCSYSMRAAGDDFMPIQPFGRLAGRLCGPSGMPAEAARKRARIAQTGRSGGLDGLLAPARALHNANHSIRRFSRFAAIRARGYA